MLFGIFILGDNVAYLPSHQGYKLLGCQESVEWNTGMTQIVFIYLPKSQNGKTVSLPWDHKDIFSCTQGVKDPILCVLVWSNFVTTINHPCPLTCIFPA